MRRRIVRDEEFTDGEVVESWSKKRIITACLIVLVLLGVGAYGLAKIGKKATQVLGIESGPKITTDSNNSNNITDVKLPTSSDVQQVLETAKTELSQITSDNLTSSQSGIQKVIQDLQSLQGGKSQPIDVICNLVCKR